jgi:DNA polymerase III subunit epsilon
VAKRDDAHQLTLDELGTPLIDTTFVVLDLETTGLSASTDRITEVGAVKVRGGEVLGELRTFVHPGRPIPPGITAVTGITDAMVRDAPGLPAILPTVLRFLDGAVFVAHNAAFDLGFLRAAAERTGHGPLDPLVLDTARLARRLVRDEVRDCRLATLARFFRSPTRAEHRALADARATVDVLHGLIERAGALGATTVEDLRDLSSSRSDTAFRRRDLVSDAPRTTGIYRFLDARDQVLYVGKATDLRDRLRTYFGQDPRRRIADLVRETARVDWTITATLLEAEVREVREIHAHRPRYNRRSTRPEAAVHVALTKEAFPRLSVVREPRATHQRTVGPLPSRKVADRFVEAVLEVVPLRACSPRLRRAQDHPACVLKDLGKCGAPCDGTQSPEGYAEVVADVLALLDDPERLLAPLRMRMGDYAGAGRFERAVETRRQLHGSARALHAARDHELLGAIEQLVVSRATPDGTEVVVVRRGRLVDSQRLPMGAGDTQVLAALQARMLPDIDGPPHRDDAEEVALVLAWLARPGIRLVEVEGELALPRAGGAALHATLREARQVARAVRRDHQHLAGAKITRRDPARDDAETTTA